MWYALTRVFPGFRALALVLSTLPFATMAAEPGDWTGVWDTQWRGGGAVMELQQDGNQVVGTYPGFRGEVEGRIDGSELAGKWSDAAGEGVFIFVMSPDQQSFMGRFGTGEWWTGVRTDKKIQETLFGKLDASSAELTLLSFLKAGNQAGEGRSDRLGVVFQLLDFSAFDDSLTPYDRIDLARLLFQIVDRLTFRVWELRPNGDLSGAEEYTVNLTQAGTNLPYSLTFRPGEPTNGTGSEPWRIVVPPEAEMREALEALLDNYDGAVPHPRKHHELASPRDTMRTFLEQWNNARNGKRELFLKTMDLSQIAAAVREDEGFLLGEYLIEVLYRIGLPLRQEIPDDPNRQAAYTHFVHPAGTIEIQPVGQEDGSFRWQFSAETMASARQLFMAMEDMPLAQVEQRRESTPFFEIRNNARSIHRDLLQEAGAGVEVWQWIALALLLVISIPLSWVFTWIVAQIFQLKKSDENHSLSAKVRFLWPLRLILIAGLGLLALRTLGLPQAVDIPLRVFIGVTLSIAGGWLAYHLVDKVSEMLDAHSHSNHRYRDEILRSLATSIAKLAVVIGAILFLAEILSIPYQGVIAGLGIGGLAVALAARSTLENLIGGITLYADKPVEVGDFCCFGDHLGVIEGIGLRSVKVRSLDQSVITVPNAEFVNLNIENLTRRDRMLLQTTIGFRYETSPDQLRWLLAEIRKLLLRHPMVTPEPARARFAGFGNHSVDIEIFAYVKTSDFNKFFGVREDIFLRLIDIVEESGTTFAFPSTVNYLAQDSGVDSERTMRIEEIMRELRHGQKLPFPEFDLQTRTELRDSLDYPPEGSVDSGGGGNAKS
ncbi:mechanosensitive ion channel family protein [Marinobacter orientalis]|uniref:Mechanosensitive ion channel family protein n=1 Tax=Marinobacter orientalis TaxID=1928859 RepID=A0A7Y0RBE3_9GAMM|nr:mechanosensitive ion channel family protein [Marinobacter orientalis]NMT63127.1 mechanosensitive ion channel family protein [Marinobacter orientalis]TGX51783.1 mechanosensitive ion channel family protein [Marinobacter orientalis]